MPEPKLNAQAHAPSRHPTVTKGDETWRRHCYPNGSTTLHTIALAVETLAEEVPRPRLLGSGVACSDLDTPTS